MIQNDTDVQTRIFETLNAPGRWRQKLIKWLYPELVQFTKELQDYYWRQDESEVQNQNKSGRWY